MTIQTTIQLDHLITRSLKTFEEFGSGKREAAVIEFGRKDYYIVLEVKKDDSRKSDSFHKVTVTVEDAVIEMTQFLLGSYATRVDIIETIEKELKRQNKK